ncbi:hypothetical protein U8527_09905 [Kordia algicida OT-1]|uniref:Uncharacterized protein n=1 Tax=Kordia algicida OT-1 TaxID=391587 RepID=A9DVG0_9FLAO|nr:hypothetical protein [Kordia algicida]EDP96416.1 hypothetical protein KAOT1_03367 [Kordia algicida OT-1]
MIPISITIILITFFSFSPKFKNVREKYNHGFDFYFTLIATVFGVVLAFYFSNRAEEMKEKEFAFNKLVIAKSNIDQNISDNQSKLYLYKEVKLDSLNVTINPLRYPTYAENIILSDPILNKHISINNYKILVSKFENLKDMKNLFHNYSYKNNSIVAEQYNLILSSVSQIISVEMSNQKDELSQEEQKKIIERIDDSLKIISEKIYKKPMIVLDKH